MKTIKILGWLLVLLLLQQPVTAAEDTSGLSFAIISPAPASELFMLWKPVADELPGFLGIRGSCDVQQA